MVLVAKRKLWRKFQSDLRIEDREQQKLVARNHGAI